MYYTPPADERKDQKDRLAFHIAFGVATSNPLRRYSVHPDDYGGKLFEILLSNGELRNEVISVFKSIDLKFDDLDLIKSKRISIKQKVSMCITSYEEAVATRLYVMIKIIMIHLLDNPTRYDFISDFSEFVEDDKILFWHDLNSGSDIYNKFLDCGHISWTKQNHPQHLRTRIKFNRFARYCFEILEDWFIDISEIKNLTFKCTNDKVWENNLNSESMVNPMNLRLIEGYDQPPWGIHPKYGNIPFSYYLNVEPHMRYYPDDHGSGMPNIDDCYEDLNSL